MLLHSFWLEWMEQVWPAANRLSSLRHQLLLLFTTVSQQAAFHKWQSQEMCTKYIISTEKTWFPLITSWSQRGKEPSREMWLLSTINSVPSFWNHMIVFQWTMATWYICQHTRWCCINTECQAVSQREPLVKGLKAPFPTCNVNLHNRKVLVVISYKQKQGFFIIPLSQKCFSP